MVMEAYFPFVSHLYFGIGGWLGDIWSKGFMTQTSMP